MEKLVLSLVFAAKRLRRYFQAHPIAVVTDQPIKQIISRPDVAGRLQKRIVMLGEHNITYRPRTSVKGQILADFLMEKPEKSPSDTSVVETPQEPPEATEFTYALRFQFTASNNEAEYEALIAGLRIAAQMEVRNVHVLVEILKEKSIQEKEVTTVVEEDGPTWMTPIIEYLKEGTLPDDRKEASKLRIKARQYELLKRILYRRMHVGPRSVVAKAMRLGYYWPTMHRDAREMIRTCNDCQIHRLVPRNSQQPLTPITAPWSFYKWGIDIAGPFPEGLRKVKFLLVAMDYFMKWIEAKAVATITEERRERAAIREAKTKLKMAKYYNAKVRGVTFRPGDFIYRSNGASHAVGGGKLGPK
ncbi:reverse transcriptase domain-containing protein [Tanacetum coccineum]